MRTYNKELGIYKSDGTTMTICIKTFKNISTAKTSTQLVGLTRGEALLYELKIVSS